MKPSVIHIKTTKDLHIAVKVAAMKQGLSMNEYAVQALKDSLGTELQRVSDIRSALDFDNTPLNKVAPFTDLEERMEEVVIDGETITYPVITTKPQPNVMNIIEVELTPEEQRQFEKEEIERKIKEASQAKSTPLCKVHGTPLTTLGKCLQKGCKFA
jgi:hypothetical protein